MATDNRKIAVIIEPTTPNLHGYLEGIGAYVGKQPGWKLFGVDLPCYYEIPNHGRWAGDGCIIASARRTQVEEAVIASINNVVFIGAAENGACVVDYDVSAGVRSVAHYFLTHGIRHFVLFGEHGSQVKSCFVEQARELGMKFDAIGREELPALLRTETEPIGVFTADCADSIQVRQIAEEENIEIPSELLVCSLGDEVNCELATPPIPAISYPAWKIGYQAAKMLGKQLAGGDVSECVTVAPGAININGSHFHIDEIVPIIYSAVRYIELTIKSGPIRVNDLTEKFGISRSHLSKLFQLHLGQSPSDFIRLKRLGTAKAMLLEPGQMVKAVALTMGFSSTQEFARFFKHSSGVTPSQFATNKASLIRSKSDQ